MLDLSSLTSIVVNMIEKNNTTTSSFDLSNGLAKRVQKIGIGEADIVPILTTQYPAVLVYLESQEEDWASLGTTARREIDLNYVITPITYYGMGQAGDQAGELSYQELYKLTGRIEGIFRNHPDMSSTSGVMECRCSSVQYGKIKGDNYYCQTAKIKLNIKMLTE